MALNLDKGKENAKSIRDILTDINRLTEENLKLEKAKLATEQRINSEQQDISNVLKNQTKLLTFQKAEKSAILRTSNSISKISENISTFQKAELVDTKAIAKLGKDKLKIDKDISLLKQTQNKLTSETKGLTADELRDNFALAGSMEDQIKNAIILKAEIAAIQKSSNNVFSTDGVKGAKFLSDVLSKVPALSAFSGVFDKAGQAAAEAVGEMESTNFGLDKFDELSKDMSKEDAMVEAGVTQEQIDKGRFSSQQMNMESIAQMATSLGKSISAALAPAAMLAYLLNALIESDAAAADMAKQMNMSYDAALSTRMELKKSADASFNNFVTTKGMQDSLMAMSSTLGTNTMLSHDMLVQMTEMREMAGFTNKELADIGAISLTTGKSMNEITGEFMAQAKISAMQSGVLLNEKDLLKDIGKVSAATTLSFGKNPKLIAEAVATSKALGMELSKVDAIAGSLLDFESSIEAELEAELLLGKDINLEKARQAALNNDLATVAKEISEQAGSAAEFGEMNRIQQEALAKAVGMGRDDLAQTLFIQEQLVGATGEQAAETEALLNKRIAAVGLEQAQKELAKDGVEGLKQQVGQADKMSASMNRINEIFGMIGESMMPVFEMLGGILEVVGFIIKPFMLLMELTGKIGEGISNLTGPLGTLGKIMKGIVGIAIVLAAYMAFQSAAAIPFAGFVLGPIAAAATLAAGFGALSKVGDMNSPADGKTQVSTKEGGLFELSKNDDFIAAPGASKMMQGGANSGGTTIIQSENKETKETNKLLKMIGNKLTTVDMYQVQ